jgi:hypothetical protein
MTLVVADVGALDSLNADFATGRDMTLILFTNDVVPTTASINTTFTEAAGGGYAAKTLTGGSWTVAGSGAGNIPTASYAEQTFTFTGALTTNLTIYGYAILRGTTLKHAERLPSAVTPASNGDQIKITPRVQQSNGTPVD